MALITIFVWFQVTDIEFYKPDYVSEPLFTLCKFAFICVYTYLV